MMTGSTDRRGFKGRVVIAALVLGALLCSANKVHAGAEDWNDANIKWLSYEDGLKDAKESNRPMCLIFFTSWCPHCNNYSKVFSDPAVVEKSKAFVMVRADADKNRDLGEKYKPDGSYIPRTFFLNSKGEIDESLNVGRDQYKYFYDEKDPASILAGMDRALKKLAAK